jgi:transposase
MADVLAVRDAYRAQQWEMVVQECAASGLSNREFCHQRGIAEKSFYYWQRKLRRQIVESASPQLVPLEPPAVSEKQLCIQYRGAELKLPVYLLYVLSVLPYYGKSLSHELLEAQMPWNDEVQNRYRNAAKIATE